MIQVVQGFKLATRESVDNRIILTKAEMVAVNDNQMPDVYFAVCKDDLMLYIYQKSIEPSIETGKFRPYSSAKIESITVNGVDLPIDAGKVDLPLATAEKYGLVIPGSGLKSENGVLEIDFNSLDDGAIPFEKIDWQNAIIDGNNI